MYTVEDLEFAQAQLREWSDRFDRYDGNNPDKYQSEIRNAQEKVREIECEQKKTGLLQMTDKEKLNAALEAAFPDARHRQVVEYNGKHYERRVFPLQKSRSRKTVLEWAKDWKEVAISK